MRSAPALGPLEVPPDGTDNSNGNRNGQGNGNGNGNGTAARSAQQQFDGGGAGVRVDLEAAERAATAFLSALGIDLDAEEVRDTPARMTRAYAELFDARPPRLTTFPNSAGYDELVLARAIPFRTVCEHHLLPFWGVAHVGYLPGERIVGLSKLARLVEFFAARPQVQERLTRQLADCLVAQLSARGAGVVLEAEHTCMTLRGVRAQGARTVTSALAGALRADPHRRAEFLAMTTAPS